MTLSAQATIDLLSGDPSADDVLGDRAMLGCVAAHVLRPGQEGHHPDLALAWERWQGTLPRADVPRVRRAVAAVRAPPPPRQQRATVVPELDARPLVEIGGEDVRAERDRLVAALVGHPHVYLRGSGAGADLVRAGGEHGPYPVELTIEAVQVLLAERVACRAWRTATESYEPTPLPQRTAGVVLHGGPWPGARPLSRVSRDPVVAPDGQILGAGYHPPDPSVGRGGLLVELRDEWRGWSLPDPDDHLDGPYVAAAEAAAALSEVVDEAGLDDAGRAAWIAGVLTVVGRDLIRDAVPAVLLEAAHPGSGKGLLARCACLIATGEDVAPQPLSRDPDEQRKMIVAKLRRAPSAVILDNLDGAWSSPALCSLLTSTTYEDRVLGSSADVTLSARAVWWLTGNNPDTSGEIGRRILPVRLDPGTARPEQRRFRRPDLVGWVRGERTRLYAACLTLLVAWIRAGRPGPTTAPWGSYETWSAVVARATAWATGIDPTTARATLESRDDAHSTLAEQLDVLQGACGSGGQTSGELHMLTDLDRQPVLEPIGLRGPTVASTGRRLGALVDRRDLTGRRLVRRIDGRRHVWLVEADP